MGDSKHGSGCSTEYSPWGGIMVLEVWQRDRSSSPTLTKKGQKEERV